MTPRLQGTVQTGSALAAPPSSQVVGDAGAECRQSRWKRAKSVIHLPTQTQPAPNRDYDHARTQLAADCGKGLRELPAFAVSAAAIFRSYRMSDARVDPDAGAYAWNAARSPGRGTPSTESLALPCPRRSRLLGVAGATSVGSARSLFPHIGRSRTSAVPLGLMLAPQHRMGSATNGPPLSHAASPRTPRAGVAGAPRGRRVHARGATGTR